MTSSVAAATGGGIKAMRRRCGAAFAYRKRWDALVDEVYDYCIPYRNADAHRTPGEGRLDLVYDATAPKGAMRFAGRMQTELTPLFETFFTLEPGPGAKVALEEDEVEELARIYEAISEAVSAVLRTERFHAESHGLYLDLFAGTAYMLVLDGESDAEPVEFCTVPYYEVAIRTDAKGRIVEYFWKKKWPADEVIEAWPNGRFSDDLRKKASAEQPGDVQIVQATRLDRKARRWVHTVYCHDDRETEPPISEETFGECPWISPRFYVVPGEPYGRGLGMIAMPNIKCVNTARELMLRNAEFGLLGMYTYRQDEINPGTIEWRPGGMIPVKSTGGQYREPSLQPLQLPGNFDLSAFVIDDERMQIKQLLLDESLPPETGAVRSPTEIIERMKLLASDLGGAYGRLVLELVVPLVRRIIEVLHGRGMLPFAPPIDQLFTQIKVTSPIAASESAMKVGQVVEWLTMVLQLGGEDAMVRAARVEDIWPTLGSWIGVPASLIRDKKSAGQLEAIIERMAAARAQQMVEQAMAEPQSGAPAAGGGGLPMAA